MARRVSKRTISEWSAFRADVNAGRMGGA
jgi:hypothetical protein